MRRLEQRFNKGMVKYRLIEDGDKILVGLSGGKDSLALLELLAKRSRILKPRFTVMAVHIGMTNIPYQSDLEYLKNYAEGLECHLCILKHRSICQLILVNLRASFVRGIGGRLFSQLLKSMDVLR